jgi:hypothetical protein
MSGVQRRSRVVKHLGQSSELLLVVLFVGACSRSPVTPTAAANAPATAPAAPAAPEVPIPPGTRVFASPAPTSPSQPLIGAWTLGSKYQLQDDGTFSLSSEGHDGYRGTYVQRADGTITFDFTGSSRWQAIGTLSDDKLTVRYNLDMELSDFEDAVYTLTASTQRAHN